MDTLVLHPGALGDLILSLPALEVLRRTCRGGTLTVAANLDHARTVLAGVADSIVPLSSLPLHRLFGADAPGPEDVAFWQRYSWVVSWTGAGDPLFTRNLQLANPHATVAAWRPASGEPRHVARIFLDSLGISDDAADALSPTVRIPRSTVSAAREWLAARGVASTSRLVAIHPGAGSAAKRWPLERFRAVAGRLSREEVGDALVLEGPAETGVAVRLCEGLLHVHAVQSASLDLTAGLLSLCDAYIGNDSGISHLAAAVGAPTLVLFGPTAPEHWAPLGPHVSVLRAPSNELCDLSEDQVWQELVRLLGVAST